ncbi:MAG: division/cell wall cluster transcriptional repressor MraZ [Bacteroidetes bacterium]|nr:division/cell wall cluster transcriptional repressor MraZ [Bacteroidota bacterium]
MIRFLGEYEATLDAKGRFLFPTGFRRQIPEGETGSFFINRGFERCLTLYPMKNWEPIFEEISNKNDFDAKVREFRRYFLNGVTVEMDSAGRLLLPKNLMEYAGLQKDIVLLSAIDKIEIWDKDKYQQLFDTFSPEAFSSLAQEVMAAKKEG